MNQPAVSILIPTYNYARFLPEAIESVLAQDFIDFELLIADDASTDNTAEVCMRYTEKDRRIRFVRHEHNLGMVENWNWCLRAACGRYIKYLLADDRFDQPYALRRLVEAIGLPGVSLVTSARNLIDDTSRTTGLWNPLGTEDLRISGKQLVSRCLHDDENLIGEPTAVLFRAADAVCGFDLGYRQLVDLEMWFYLLQQGDLAYISTPLCCFRRHPAQQTEANRKTGMHWYEMAALCRRYLRGSAGKTTLFCQLCRIRKRKHSELARLEAELRADFTSVEYPLYYFQYKFLRLIRRIKRSAVRRLQGCREGGLRRCGAAGPAGYATGSGKETWKTRK
ncbi:MAG: glycosyltransferase family A protein [Kiritimatiellales bacterium]